MTTAIQFEGVSKRFIIRHERNRSFQDVMVNLFRRNISKEEFWALRDVSLEVKQGQAFGIVGQNGSGKSTALKLTTRIIEPTNGRVTVDGTVSALLELGAGFHPELSGRDNIYLNGSLLGISRKEMERKFESIVEFAELKRFIDVPIKHYSSGMYVRLGFAIAVSVDPEILIIDEVLAVGDEAFQRKCMDKIAEFKREGRTILLVSHSMDAVRALCDVAAWLDNGVLRVEGKTDAVIDAYLRQANEQEAQRLQVSGRRPVARTWDGKRWGSGEIEITAVEFLDANGVVKNAFVTGETMIARLHYVAHERLEAPVFGVAIYRDSGAHLAGPNTSTSGYHIPFVEGEGIVDCVFQSLPLLEGTYEFSAAVYDSTCTHPYDHHDRTYTLFVRATRLSQRYGMVYMPCRWSQHNGRQLPEEEGT
ncbi:MAG: ABC transporter ATP-binding protein [Chloroflexi bacterium]|nr:ABC transporter ATP-binding protein [Chloroflexota bacterium]